MRCLKLIVAYRGTEYCGWQFQDGQTSVQEVLENAFEKIIGEKVRLTASGRTDSGVHALGQVVGAKIQSEIECRKLILGLNATTPFDISVLSAEEVTEDFHAIRSAKRKRYRYRIQYGTIADPIDRDLQWFLPYELNVESMRKGAEFLLGKHDFACFQAAGSDRKTTVRTILECTLEPDPASILPRVIFEIEGSGFLYNMVRNIVGSLVKIGRGKKDPEWISELIAGKDRTLAGETAPAQGLFLLKVDY